MFIKFSGNNQSFNVTREDGRTVTVAAFPPHIASVNVAAARWNLEFAAFVDTANSKIEDLSVEGWAKLFPTLVAPLLAAQKALYAAARDANEKAEAVRKELLTPDVPLSPSQSAEMRAYIGRLSNGEALKAALSDIQVANAALADWPRSGLPDTIKPACEKFVMITHASQRAIAIAPTAPATFDNPIPSGADAAWIENYATEWVGKVEAQRDMSDTLVAYSRSAVDFLAVAGNTTVETAFSNVQASN